MYIETGKFVLGKSEFVNDSEQQGDGMSSPTGNNSENKGMTSPTSTTSREEKKSKAILQILPKLPSSESLSNSPGPASPGLSTTDKFDNTSSSDKLLDAASKLTRKESYKAQRKNYRREKKRVANELLSSLKDPSVIVLADWLKVRGTLKSWTKLWCILKPGLLLLYKTPKTKSNHWVGTVLLNTCQVIERPSKKDGFCFKLFHPLEQSIWAPRGPEKETIGAVVQPLPTAYLIFRAPSQAAGKCWLDALELSLRCSSLLVRSMSNKSTGGSTNHETQWSEADYEKHFTDHDLDDISQPENGAHLSGVDVDITDSESECSAKEEEFEDDPPETHYFITEEEEFGGAGEQVEELAEEHKSLIWFLVKQVRPGMDLSKVVLPTFILEPRSFLDKLSDSYYHVDILSRAVLEDDAFTRMKSVVQWYLSGLYKKPKGLKKPYNPILGETFRCYWQHPSGSRTFYISEQVSHHPPVSAFYVTNRQDGFCISASILAKSKFYGNSTSAILDGVAVLTLLPRGEDYSLTVPYAHCKGILMGTLTMELGGKVAIDCEKTGYRTEIDFKLKPFLGGAEHTNCVSGRLRLGKETLATIEGYWDGKIVIKDRRTGEEQVLWNPTASVRSTRLKRYTVPVDHQSEFESERLWQHVSAAILRDDQQAATEEKTVLEEAQRASVKERKAKCEDWAPKHFEQDLKSGQWMYRHGDLRPWDPRNDVYQFEYEYIIQTKTKHPTPMIRTASIVSVEPQSAESRTSLSVLKSSKRKLTTKQVSSDGDVNESGTTSEEFHSDSTQSTKKVHLSNSAGLLNAVQSLENTLLEHGEKLTRLQQNVDNILKKDRGDNYSHRTCLDTVIIVLIVLIMQMLWMYISS